MSEKKNKEAIAQPEAPVVEPWELRAREAEKDLEFIKELLRQAEHDRDIAVLEAKQTSVAKDEAMLEKRKAESNLEAMNQKRKQELRSFQIQLRRVSTRHIRSIKWPCVAVAVFAVLAILAAVAVANGLMSHLLGEPVGYGALCVSSFFAAIVGERLTVKGAIEKENKNASS